jgi:hypothetical protein
MFLTPWGRHARCSECSNARGTGNLGQAVRIRLTRWILKTLLLGVVLNSTVDPGMAEVSDLGEKEQIFLAVAGRLLPLALPDDLASLVDLVILLPDPVEGDVVDDLATLQAVRPDVASKVPNSDYPCGSVMYIFLCWWGRIASLPATFRRRHRCPPSGE